MYKAILPVRAGSGLGDAGITAASRLCSGGAVEDGPEAFRGAIEGRVYPALQAQMDAPEPILKA
ncbi:MAG: hypothetical protein OXG36_01160 [Caldilineaceae bacterium]|nr:hypothetical protein [Caldilineaceae bacterium]